MQPDKEEDDVDATDYERILQYQEQLDAPEREASPGAVHAEGKVVLKKVVTSSRIAPLASAKSQVQTERLSCLTSQPQTG